MIILHHLNNSRSQRILWLLEEMEVPYEIRFYQRDKKTQLAPASLKQVHPLGKSPVITDGDVTVAESGAIIEYLAYTYHPDFYPLPGTPENRQFSYWMHFSEGTLMPQLLIKLILEKAKTSSLLFLVRPVVTLLIDRIIDAYAGPNVKANLDYIEQHLGRHPWFCGEALTGADMQMSFPLEAFIAEQGGEGYPNIQAYVKKFQARPAYQRALQAGGDYDYGPKP